MFKMLKIKDTLYINTKYIKSVYIVIDSKYHVIIRDEFGNTYDYFEHEDSGLALESLEKLIRMIDS